MDDLDIYRSANVLVKCHGQDAPIEAAMRADAMLEKGVRSILPGTPLLLATIAWTA